MDNNYNIVKVNHKPKKFLSSAVKIKFPSLHDFHFLISVRYVGKLVFQYTTSRYLIFYNKFAKAKET